MRSIRNPIDFDTGRSKGEGGTEHPNWFPRAKYRTDRIRMFKFCGRTYIMDGRNPVDFCECRSKRGSGGPEPPFI